MTTPGATLVVRTAVIADAPSVAAIGRMAFPAVHNDVVGPEFAAVVVEQTYSIRGADGMHHAVHGRQRRGIPRRRTGRRRDRLPALRLRRARARTPPHLCRSCPEARWCGQRSDARATRSPAAR